MTTPAIKEPKFPSVINYNGDRYLGQVDGVHVWREERPDSSYDFYTVWSGYGEALAYRVNRDAPFTGHDATCVSDGPFWLSRHPEAIAFINAMRTLVQ